MDRIRKTAPLIILFVLVVAGAAYAQQVTKIATVDSQKAFGDSVEGKRAMAQLQDKGTKIKADIQKMDDSIRLLENRMNTGRLTMTNEALIALQADIDKKTTDRKRYEEDASRDAQQLQANLIQRIRVEMVAIIEALAKEKGLELVLDTTTSGVITASPTIDITDEVIKRYDASKVTAPATPPVKK
jgi:Skp family chaperone for outer membrane proteins